MINMTSIGGELGCSLKPKTKMTKPSPPAKPIPIPLSLAPTKMQPRTTANSIQNNKPFLSPESLVRPEVLHAGFARESPYASDFP